MIIAVIFFICISAVIILGLANPVVRHFSMATSIATSKESFYAAEAGVEDIFYRLNSSIPVASSQTLFVGDHSVTTEVENEPSGKVVTASGEADNYLRKIKAHLALGTGVSFRYGIQAGAGGFELFNTSSVTGNIHSSGPITGHNGNGVNGDVISAGPGGIIDGIHTTGNAYAHTINNSVIDKDAYYATTISGTMVSGVSHPGSPDQETADLPISDAQINGWENIAQTGGIIPASDCVDGTYDITSDITLGPVKIECNLFIKGNDITLTIAGPIWVVGDIETQLTPDLRIIASLGNQNVALIADNPSNRAGSGIIKIGQGTEFYGSGSPNSFVFTISQNNSAETGGSTDAISIGQSAGGEGKAVAYASHGQITLGQSVDVKEATAYKIILQNSANVTYDIGLPSAIFSSGPSGGFSVSTWKEVE